MKFSESHKEDKNLTDQHREKLGLDIPEGYFQRSKEDILKALPKIENPTRRIYRLKALYAYPIAASLVLLIGILFFTQWKDRQADPQLTEIENSTFEFPTDDLLISSLMVDDNELDEFMDDYIMYEIIEEAERTEQELDDVFLNSLFVEDSLIDAYMDENLLDKMIL